MIIQLHEGGSEHGITTIKEYVNGCSKKAFLNKEGGGSHSLATLTGTLVHALLEEYYHRGYFETDQVKWKGFDFTDPLFAPAESKAFNVFREYKMRFTPTELGKVVGNEQFLETKDAHVIGCTPYTCRIDLVVKLLKRDCKRLRKTRGLDIDSGIWIVDHKTSGGVYPNTFEALTNSVQFTAYMRLYEHVLKKRVAGTLVNFMTTTKNPAFHTLAVPRPNQLSMARLNAVTEEANFKGWPQMSYVRANESRCYDFMSVCPHWVSAKCKGF